MSFQSAKQNFNKYIPKNRLGGRIAIITGSTEGIGFGIAKRLTQEGAKVIISSRKQKNVDKALIEFKKDGLEDFVVGIVCHVGKAQDREKLFQEAVKLGGLDILISNVAVNVENVPLSECSEGAWDKVFDVNLKATFLLAKAALPLLRRSKNARILFISSVFGYLPPKHPGPYSVSKTALLGLTKAIAFDLASENITVNCIAPGFIETESLQKILEKGKLEHYKSHIPMNRVGTIEEVAGVAAFLVSEDSNYITGETIVISGGLTSRL